MGTAPQSQPSSSSGGLTSNVAAALAYIWFMAIIWLVVEPYNKDRFVRFHAFQSLAYAVCWVAIMIVLGIIPFVGWILMAPVHLALFIVWVICIFKAFQNEKLNLPVISKFAEEQANK
jgi:uncharacterized membrane protein